MFFMKTIHYYPYTPYDYETSEIDDFPELLNLYYDLEKDSPPHRREYSSIMDKCPAMNVYSSHTYVLRSPFDFKIKYDYTTNQWDTSETGEEERGLIILPFDNTPYIQVSIFYLFWSPEKSNITLWQHDPPLWALSGEKDWYVTSGMFPVGEYVRNISIGLALKSGGTTIDIKRGDIITSVSFIGDERISLKKQRPSRNILQQNINNFQKKSFCPYKYSLELFRRWF